MTSSIESTRLLNQVELRDLAAAVDRLLPADEQPGAVELGIVDRIVAGLENAPGRLAVIRAGLAGLAASALASDGSAFADLPPASQADLLRAFQRNEPPAGAWSATTAQQFFRQLRQEVVERYYGDPRVWPLVGYPGYSMPAGYPDGGPCGALEARS